MTKSELYKDELDNLIFNYYEETGNLITKEILEQILTIIFKFIYIENN